MAQSAWLEDLQRAAQLTAQREQRGRQMTLGDMERTEDEPRTAAAAAQESAPAATPAPPGRPHETETAQGVEKRANSEKTAAQPRRQLHPFIGHDPARDYRRIYRILFDFHERHNPPRGGAEYWDDVCDDMTQTAAAGGDDPFLMDLLVAVFSELEREAAAAQALGA